MKFKVPIIMTATGWLKSRVFAASLTTASGSHTSAST